MSVTRACRLAKVSRSGLYRHLQHPCRERDPLALERLRSLHEQSRGKLGGRRLKMAYERTCGEVINLKKVRRMQQQYGLRSSIRRPNKWRMLNFKGQEHVCAPNLVGRRFDEGPVLSTDVTELRLGDGRRAYVAVTRDLEWKGVVGHVVASSMTLEKVAENMDQILEAMPETRKERLLVHSDQGGHYTHAIFRDVLAKHGVRQSMSRKGNCLDNSPIESFFGHMKDEMDWKRCRSLSELKRIVAEYMDEYNNRRPQWGLEMKTPAEWRGLVC